MTYSCKTEGRIQHMQVAPVSGLSTNSLYPLYPGNGYSLLPIPYTATDNGTFLRTPSLKHTTSMASVQENAREKLTRHSTYPTPKKTVTSSQSEESPFANFIAGGFGGTGSVLAGHPLDTVKVRLQTQNLSSSNPNAVYKGMCDCAVKIVKHEGFLGLYQGMLFPLLIVTPRASMAFFGFSLGKGLLTPEDSRQEDLLPHQLLVAGSISGVFSTVLMVPAERVKCLLQVQAVAEAGTVKYAGSMDCAKKLYTEMGFARGLYRGALVTLMRDIPFNATFFTSYTLLKNSLDPSTDGSEKSWSSMLLAGGLAGVLSWSVAFVPDTLKSRIQSAPLGAPVEGIRQVFTNIMRSEGTRGLFRGLSPVLIRAFPANMAFFGCYEAAMKVVLWLGG